MTVQLDHWLGFVSDHPQFACDPTSLDLPTARAFSFWMCGEDLIEPERCLFLLGPEGAKRAELYSHRLGEDGEEMFCHVCRAWFPVDELSQDVDGGRVCDGCVRKRLGFLADGEAF